MARNSGRYKVDKSGSRCRDTSTGRWADCVLCRTCPLKKKK